jgi:hypothetical protein
MIAPGGLLSKPKLPPQKDPVRMPVEGDDASRDAARRRRQELLAREGRQSTDLTGGDSSLGT